MHEENLVAIRTLHLRVSWCKRERFAVDYPDSVGELDYRDLLSEVNEAFLQSEYSVAPKPDLRVRDKILNDLIVYIDTIDFGRMLELSRRFLVDAKPGRPVVLPADGCRRFAEREVKPNPTLVNLALRLYAQQVKRATAAGDLRLAADADEDPGRGAHPGRRAVHPGGRPSGWAISTVGPAGDGHDGRGHQLTPSPATRPRRCRPRTAEEDSHGAGPGAGQIRPRRG